MKQKFSTHYVSDIQSPNKNNGHPRDHLNKAKLFPPLYTPNNQPSIRVKPQSIKPVMNLKQNQNKHQRSSIKQRILQLQKPLTLVIEYSTTINKDNPLRRPVDKPMI